MKSGYKQTSIGDIPKSWRIKKLRELGSFSKGKGIFNKDKIDNGFFCITYGEIYTKHDYVINQFDSFISAETAKKSRKITNNDLLFAGSGETLDEIGKCVAYTKNSLAYAGGDIIVFTPCCINSIYLSYIINSDFIIRHRRKLGQGHSVVHIYIGGLKTLSIPLPPLLEQKKIAEILSAWDSVIKVTNKLIEAKKKLKKGLMQQLLTGKTRFKEFGKSLENGVSPEGWKEKILKEVFFEEKRPAKLKDDYQYNLVTVKRRNGGVEKRSNLQGREILTKNQFYIKGNDFLISKRQIVHGACGVVPNDLSDSIVSNEYLVLRVRNGFSITYLRYFSSTPVFQKDCYLSSIGVHIEKMLFKPQWWFKTKYYFPSLLEQNYIASVLTTADKEIEILNKKLKAIKQQKKGLMQQLLTGKKRVKV